MPVGAAGRRPQDAPLTFADGLEHVQHYCTDCHNSIDQTAGVDFERYETPDDFQADFDVWEKVVQVVGYGQMPPEDAEQPTKEERAALVAWAKHELNSYDCEGVVSPGRVTLRRLNRAEYNNTIRDLTGLDFRPADVFPSDDVGYGFDNIGDVLSMTPLLMEKYLAAAEQVALRAIETTPPQQKRLTTKDYRRLKSNLDDSIDGDLRAHLLYTNAEVKLVQIFPDSGLYSLQVKAYEQPAGDESARLVVKLDGEAIQSFDVTARRRSPGVYATRPVQVEPGRHEVTAAFVNDYYNPGAPEEDERDRNLAIERFIIDGPLVPDAELRSESHRRIIGDLHVDRRNPAPAAAKVLRRFASTAFRRPATDSEVHRLTEIARSVYEQGGSFEEGVQLCVQALLSSPSFLFRVEQDADPATDGPYRQLNEYELASRLSYFLWSSMPDEDLFAQAAQGALRDNLDAQVRRMLRDPKAEALAKNFGGQWLTLRNLDEFDPDPEKFPEFDEELRQAMREETLHLFRHIVREDRSVFDFLEADYTYLNERLADHYNVDDVEGAAFQLTSMADDRRGGVLTHASILALTSDPTRTSPVKRGKWVLEQILDQPPPPPPPGAGELPEDGPELVGTLRQRMVQHRDNPTCASCHQRMDPIGFGLENFDAVGAWRETDHGEPIDSSGVLPGGKSFNGPAELRKILSGQREQFRKTLAKKMLTYAIGRGVEKSDRCAIRFIVDQMERGDDRFSALVLGVIHSDPFQLRGAAHGVEKHNVE